MTPQERTFADETATPAAPWYKDAPAKLVAEFRKRFPDGALAEDMKPSILKGLGVGDYAEIPQRLTIAKFPTFESAVTAVLTAYEQKRALDASFPRATPPIEDSADEAALDAAIAALPKDEELPIAPPDVPWNQDEAKIKVIEDRVKTAAMETDFINPDDVIDAVFAKYGVGKWRELTCTGKEFCNTAYAEIDRMVDEVVDTQSRPQIQSASTAETVPDVPTPHVEQRMATVPIAPLTPELGHWEMLRQQAVTLIKSGFMPKTIGTPEQAITVMMMGEALGIKPIIALNMINVISGKPTVSPQLMMALVRQSGQLEYMQSSDDGNVCTVKMKRKNEPEHVEVFSASDAKAMQLDRNSNWQKQPAVMRRWRAISAACRIVFPDIILGFYTPEEMNPNATASYDAETGELVA